MTTKEKSNKNCQDCAKYHREQCPNSFDCYNTEEDYLAGHNEAKKEANTWVEVYDAPLSIGTFPKLFESLYGINMPYQQRYACYYDGDIFISEETGVPIEITHWMYAPEAPKE